LTEIFYTVEINTVAKSEVLITSLLLQTETSFQSRNWFSKLAVCTRPRPTACGTIICRISKMADN